MGRTLASRNSRVTAPDGGYPIDRSLLGLHTPLVGPGRALFRPMREEHGQPRIAPNGLGVRLPEDGPQYGGVVDIYPDDEGAVHPESGGMSVTLDDPFEIPPHRRPASLGGDGDWPLWRILSDDLPERLATRNDRDFHGLVEPSQQMSADEYVQSLESTQPKWDLET